MNAGEVKIFATRKLTPLRRVKRAHTIFVTSITFAQDSQSVVSTSADATARVTMVASPSGNASKPAISLSQTLILAVVVLLVAVGVQLYRQQSMSELSLQIADLQEQYSLLLQKLIGRSSA